MDEEDERDRLDLPQLARRDPPRSASRPTRSEAPRPRSRRSAPSPPSARRTIPAETASTRSPGEQRLTIADSNPPVPEQVKRSTSDEVRWTSFSRPSTRA